MKIERVGTGTTASRVLAIAGLVIGLSGCGLSDGPTLPGASPENGSKAAAAGIPSGTWRLASLRQAGQAEVVIGQTGVFTAEFGADGRSSLLADCNRCSAAYSADGRSLSVGPMACTRAFCTATAPLDTTYTALVGSARTWSVSADGRLELSSDAGTLRFQR